MFIAFPQARSAQTDAQQLSITGSALIACCLPNDWRYKLRGPEGAQRLRATSASTSEFGSITLPFIGRLFTCQLAHKA
jgi:hypothetical protein